MLAFSMCLWAAGALAAEATTAPSPPAVRNTLPQNHECQKQLRDFMATLTEKDFTHGVTGGLDTKAASDKDPDYLYRNHLFTQMRQPLIGTKDSVPAVQAPPDRFLLSSIEKPEAVCLPPIWPETLTSLVQWDYPGNPFRNNKALKLRAFVGAVVQMTMFMDFAESNDGKVPPPVRPDWHGYNPVIWAASYPGFKDALPAEVQRAYEACLKTAGERILSWPVRGETCETDLLGPLGLIHISRAINDAEFARKVEAYTRPMFTDPQSFHPAGYWNERGGIDMAFGGMANFYATWIALMTDWPFTKEPLERAYRLRGHLLLPEPDGTLAGPTHFNSRLGSAQEEWAYARAGAAMLTDEVAWLVKSPTPEQLAAAPGARARLFNDQLQTRPKVNLDFYTEEELKNVRNRPWMPRIWMTYRFPISVNPSYEHYRKGAFARRKALEESDSPMLKSPFLRGENFVRAFEKDFVVTRQPDFAAIIHTGPVGVQTPDDHKTQYPGPMGLGGGQLSAFWTPKTGAVILGLRSGMSLEKSHDKLDAWRTWPIHAITGGATGGKVFTSARNARPQVVTDLNSDGGTVKVSGPMVALKVVKDPDAADKDKARDLMYDEPMQGKVEYARTFKIDGKGVSVETRVSGDGKDGVADIYETLPIYLGTGQEQKSNANVRIEVESRGKWGTLTERQTSAKAIRITRYGGAVMVTFESPRPVMLAPSDWTDGYVNKYATCRNIMIGMRGADEFTGVDLRRERVIRYVITPVSEPATQPSKGDK